MKNIYDIDFHQWTKNQAQLLIDRKFDLLDFEHLIEEILDVGNSKKDALESNLEVLLMHLLKWFYQPEKRTNSWRSSIVEHGRRINKILRKNPSLKPYFDEVFDECFDTARALASAETGKKLGEFPAESPFSKDFVLNAGDTFVEH